MLVKVINKFHGTEYTFRVNKLPAELTPNQMRKAEKAMCGMDDCCCGGLLNTGCVSWGNECYVLVRCS